MFPDRRFLGSLSATPDDESMTTTSNSGLSVFIIWYEAQALSTTETDFRIRPELSDLIMNSVIIPSFLYRLKGSVGNMGDTSLATVKCDGCACDVQSYYQAALMSNIGRSSLL